MADNCKIEWVAGLAKQRGMASRSWNPVIGCSRASEGCLNCYAAAMVDRFARKDGTGVYATLTERDGDGVPRFNGKIDFSEKRLVEPLSWRKPAVVFAGDMADLFHPSVTDDMLDRIFAVMALRPDHLFLVLTKRPERMRAYLTELRGSGTWRIPPKPITMERSNHFWAIARDMHLYQWMHRRHRTFTGHWAGGEPPIILPNIWLGVTAENQATADARIPHLLATPAVKRFVSVEPMLGPVDLTEIYGEMGDVLQLDALAGKHYHHDDGGLSTPARRLDWVICGGESGPNARPMHPDWARALRDQCKAAGVPFSFKQWGGWEPHDHVGSETAESLELENRYEFFADCHFVRVGKKAAGRLLDGHEWDEVPK